MPDTLFRFANAAVRRPARGDVLSRITWDVRDGETWAVVGPNGSGKTTLGQALVGRLPVIGEVEWPLLARLRAAGRHATVASDVARFVGFREESAAFSYRNHYYQERFNFTDPHEDVTLREFLRSGTRAADADLHAAADRLGVAALLDHSFLTLSNGQTRRARIAKAVLARPAVLVLDDPFAGLDAAGRETVSDLVGGLVRSGMHVVLLTDAGTVPAWVTHVLELEDGQIGTSGRNPVSPALPPSGQAAFLPPPGRGEGWGGGRFGREDTPHPNPPPQGGREPEESGNLLLPPPGRGEGWGGGRFGREDTPHPNPPPQGGREPESEGSSSPLRFGERLPSPTSPLLELRDVTVAYGGRPVLDGVSWTVRAGERWALLGPNGSGKSTLLSLTVGDHPQVYANDVSLFGKRRGTGETIWDVKRNVGLLSPELHLYFTEPLTAEQTVATGFVDAVAYRRPTPEQAAAVRERMAEFGLSHLAARPFAQLSTGEQRLVLFVRAVVKRPALLILDEPFQGLDSRAVRRARAWLDANLGPEQALVFVTHFPAEIPSCVDRVLRLEGGRVTASSAASCRTPPAAS